MTTELMLGLSLGVNIASLSGIAYLLRRLSFLEGQVAAFGAVMAAAPPPAIAPAR